MKIRSKARDDWEQNHRENAAKAELRQQREDEENNEWLAETFDGATVDQFGSEGIEVRLSTSGYRHYLHVRGDCPRCGERAWSRGVNCWISLGEMLNGEFCTDYHLHKCKRPPTTECADPADKLRDALLEILELEEYGQ